ncbi:MAG TPA: Asp23/Gls24 family envelope stress response protein [Candidatus Limnocylindrales bacterium]|nr:Asp23/Gls24 family envelope stress response protein [Candidatus Limnocylindrales bacterium]
MRKEDVARVRDPIPGRSLVTRRALRDVVRNATLGVYGVTGFSGGGPVGRALVRLGLAEPGIRLRLDGQTAIDLHLTVAYGLPVAEVARQVDASVRWAIRHATGRELDRLTIHVDGLRYEPGQPPPGDTAPSAPGPTELAGSGSDVA